MQTMGWVASIYKSDFSKNYIYVFRSTFSESSGWAGNSKTLQDTTVNTIKFIAGIWSTWWYESKKKKACKQLNDAKGVSPCFSAGFARVNKDQKSSMAVSRN